MSFRVQGWGRPSLTRSLGRQCARAAPAPRWVPEGSSRPMDDPLGRPRAVGFIVFRARPGRLPRRGSIAVLLASWLFSATRALVLNDRRRTQRAARGVIAAVEPGAGRPTPAHTSEKDDPLGLTEPHPARSKLTAPHVHHRVVGRSVASR